jgi:hypothetical protein
MRKVINIDMPEICCTYVCVCVYNFAQMCKAIKLDTPELCLMCVCVYVCVCVCVCVYIYIYIYIYINTYTHNTHTHTHTHTHIYIYICTYIHIYKVIKLDILEMPGMHVCMYACISTYQEHQIWFTWTMSYMIMSSAPPARHKFHV